ncbi:hypothetical protein ACFQZE_06865 [Paenibacillus sp. GCM10027627]|uniref:hypothetical protein n=1 Tax=unclassified Paenibacillus TaxID=185978 RepID=UPI003631B8BA
MEAIRIAEALYVVNKQAKVYRDLRDYCYEFGKQKNQQAKIEKGNRYDEMKEELYILKNAVLEKVIIESVGHIVGFHKYEEEYLLLIKLSTITFHKPIHESHLRRLFAVQDIDVMSDLTNFRGVLEDKIPLKFSKTHQRKYFRNTIKISMPINDAIELLKKYIDY